jgi:phosphoribosylformylglycinamidine synthase
MPDLDAIAALADLVRGLVADDLLLGVHDVADGGLALALAEMAVVSGVGIVADEIFDHHQLFGESPDRAVLCVAPALVGDVIGRASAAGVGARVLGSARGERLALGPLVDLTVAEAVAAWRDRLPNAFGTAVTH